MTDFQVIFMDAGQGDCTLIVYPDNSLTLVDCGSTKSGDEAFAEIQLVLDRFLPENNNTINNLVLTHPDADHFNKLKDLVKRKPPPKIGHVYYGGHIDLYSSSKDMDFTYGFLKKQGEAPKNTHYFVPDTKLSRAGVNVTILAVNASGSPKGVQNKNKNSIVLMVEYGPVKMFLMGDAFIETEEHILLFLNKANKASLLQKALGQEFVLKMGHHGSDTSTGQAWVSAINPNIIVISSGTKRFKGKGMPTLAHLTETVNSSSLINTGFSQTYVVFNQEKRGLKDQDFMTMPATNQAIWTTCYAVNWTGNGWLEYGQTWYYGVTPPNRKKSPQKWYGYTGYEEEDDVEDDT